MIAFRGLQRKRQAEFSNQGSTVRPGGENDGVCFDHFSCARSDAADLTITGQNVRDFRPGS